MNQVTAEEVKSFLDSQDHTGVPDGTNILNIEEAVKQRQEEDMRIKEMQDSVEKDRVKTFDPQHETLTNISPWKIDDTEFKVEVTDEDKVLYLKSLLTDAPVKLNVKLEMGISFELKSLTNYDLEIIHSAMMSYVDNKKVIGPAQYASVVQQCSVALQVCKIQDTNLDPPSFTPEKICISDAVLELQNRVEKVIGKWAWPKWQSAVTALRIFEYKLALCNANARESNFWKTAEVN